MTPQEYLDWCKDMAERLQKYEYHFTNGDKIRSMTDRELSYLISDNVECNKACKAKKEGCLYSDSTCIAAWLDWLKESVEE